MITELGKIAGDVWGSVERIGSLEGLDARVLEVLSAFTMDRIGEIMLILWARSSKQKR